MGKSDNLPGSNDEVDCSAGTIVWVRRRNGSWWPGRILGPSELSASHLVSPRSGTPVKLLGREDASVDWYNLEKSKRVKAFRCGEFDDCIERAESSQGTSIKKREKYARREDAILHALELERQQLKKKYQKQGMASNSKSSRMPSASKKEFISSENIGNDNCKFVNLKSQLLSERLDLSLEEESMGNPLYDQIAKHGKQFSREDDISEAIPRMRALEDFGLRIAPSKRKLSALIASEGSQIPLSVDNYVDVVCSGGHSMGGTNHVNSSKISLAMKKKRSQGGVDEESLVKRRDRRRTLVQVLQSSAMLPVSHSSQPDGDAVSISMQGEKEQTGVICQTKGSQYVYLPPESNDSLGLPEFPSNQIQISPTQFGTDYCLHPDSLTEESTSSGSIEEEESDSSERDYLDLEMAEKVAVISDAAQTLTVAGPKNSSRYVGPGDYRLEGKLGSISSEELVESASTVYMPQVHPYDQTVAGSADVVVSKWKLKGKRNIRNLTKRPTEMMNGKLSNRSIHGSFFKGNISNRKASGFGFYHGSVGLGNDYDEDDLFEKHLVQTQKLGFGNGRYPSTSKASRDRGIVDFEEDSSWEANGLSQVALRGYWDESGEYFDPIYAGYRLSNGLDSALVDVDLKVQASYQGEHVPLVSLMSRLNGKAIIGHPIQIEALEDGSSDILLSTNDYFSEESTDNDESTLVPPIWRTARRTAMHWVPRSHPSSALDGDEAAGPQYSGLEKKPPDKKSYAGHLGHKAWATGKISSSICRLQTKKFPKKFLKKVSLSGQKTRTLSSIATEQKASKGSDPKHADGSRLDGLIKPEETGLIAVSCIPVKLVFSRLLEAVGRSPSGSGNLGVLVNGSIERKPLEVQFYVVMREQNSAP